MTELTLDQQNKIAEAVLEMLQVLKDNGVTSFVLGVPLSEEPDGHGALKCVGRPALVLNLLAGLIGQLQPGDFHNLLITMQHGDFFAKQRGEEVKPIDPKLVN